MKFSKRIRLYLFGVLIGTAMAAFFFKDRFESTTVEEDVLNELRHDNLLFSDRAEDSLKKYGWNYHQLDSLLLQGEVILPEKEEEKIKTHFAIEFKERKNKYMADLEVVDNTHTRIKELKQVD